ncbi:hypothetical protein BN2476_230007 [Paraburkholderia piptadeniae]|uniref:Uncharacterized protein n=1 Tax=Paraburkholderia piptadeniae TaxID=1701573 RepID=A0A1N7RXK6_9BURK|nr:hypothetical protein BN2476_230007 [Paraburkholderia piptadeniae]
MTSRDIRNFDAATTASLLDYRLLVRTLAETIVGYNDGKVNESRASSNPNAGRWLDVVDAGERRRHRDS